MFPNAHTAYATDRGPTTRSKRSDLDTPARDPRLPAVAPARARHGDSVREAPRGSRFARRGPILRFLSVSVGIVIEQCREDEPVEAVGTRDAPRGSASSRRRHLDRRGGEVGAAGNGLTVDGSSLRHLSPTVGSTNGNDQLPISRRPSQFPLKLRVVGGLHTQAEATRNRGARCFQTPVPFENGDIRSSRILP